MATLPIQLPEDFPDLVVTSFYRPTGSHAGRQTVDLALDLGEAPYSDKSAVYWYYYFWTLVYLWRSQRAGTVYGNWPLAQAHYHLSAEGNAAGVEYRVIRNGKNIAQFPVYSVKRTDYLDMMQLKDYWLKTVGHDGGANNVAGSGSYYLGSWKNYARHLKSPFLGKRVVTVKGGSLVDDATLQRILDSILTDSVIDQFSFHMSQKLGYANPSNLVAEIQANAFIWGALGFVAYMLWKDQGADRGAPQKP